MNLIDADFFEDMRIEKRTPDILLLRFRRNQLVFNVSF